MKTIKTFLCAVLCLTLITSCSDDDNPPLLNPVELITNVTLTFTNVNNMADVVTLSNVAPDGQEGAFINSVSGPFTAGATYELTLAITDETDPQDIDDILNDDIIPEADEHFFVYAINGLNFTMTRDATDVVGPNGSSLGVNTTWVAGAAIANGNLQIILVHEPGSVDDSNEFGSATGGEEDFNLTFTGIDIQ